MDLPYYPINDYGPAMKGMVIGGMGIFHVFVAQFAIGGGMLMCYFQWLASTGKSPGARRFLDGYFKVLVLVSFVLGVVTGVGMWFTTIQISPRTIGLLIDEFHWLWATEWTFFCLEVFAGYTFYRYGRDLSDGLRIRLLALYSVAGWFSLFWINGILSFQLTPGAWIEHPSVWAGFFNPSFFPSLVFRTIVAMATAALVACVVINTIDVDRPVKKELINRAAHFLAPMALMPVIGGWYFLVIPGESRAWALGGSPAMSLFFAISAGASLLIGLYAIVGLVFQRLYINGATATLLVALAFGATAGGEFVREGVRKPYTVRHVLYSNAITEEELKVLREEGSVTRDPYPLRNPTDYPTSQLALGEKVFRFQCSVCHTMSGANGIQHLSGSWTTDQKRLNIAKLQRTKGFMPPFAGNAEELEALVQLIEWDHADRPGAWPVSTSTTVLAQIDRWLDEVGTAPNIAPARGEVR